MCDCLHPPEQDVVSIGGMGEPSELFEVQEALLSQSAADGPLETIRSWVGMGSATNSLDGRSFLAGKEPGHSGKRKGQIIPISTLI